MVVVPRGGDNGDNRNRQNSDDRGKRRTGRTGQLFAAIRAGTAACRACGKGRLRHEDASSSEAGKSTLHRLHVHLRFVQACGKTAHQRISRRNNAFRTKRWNALLERRTDVSWPNSERRLFGLDRRCA